MRSEAGRQAGAFGDSQRWQQRLNGRDWRGETCRLKDFPWKWFGEEVLMFLGRDLLLRRNRGSVPGLSIKLLSRTQTFFSKGCLVWLTLLIHCREN